MIRPFASRQFMLFLLTGGISAIVNFTSRIFYNAWMSYSHAVILAYLTGMVTAFVLAKCFVFTESTQALHRSAGFFILVNLFAIAQTWGISMLLAYYVLPWLHVNYLAPEIAHACGIMVPVFTSYLGHKRWSFR